MPTFDASSQSTEGAATNTRSWTHVLGSGSDRKVIIGAAAEDNSAANVVVSSVTFNGQACTVTSAVVDHRPSSRSQRSELWYIDEANLPAAGSYTVAITWTGSVDGVWGAAISLSNAASGAPEATATGTSATDTISTAITTLSNNAMLVDIVSISNTTSTNVVEDTAGQTERQELQGAVFDASTSTKAVVTAGASSMAWRNFAALRAAHAVVSIAVPAAPPAGGTPDHMLLLGVG